MIKEKDEKDDKLMMEFMKSVADTVEKMIKTEEDYPSKYKSNLLPILDLQVSVNDVTYTESNEDDVYRKRRRDKESDEEREKRREREKELKGVGQMNFQFYRKIMAPRRTILAKSAMPMRIKRTTATQECLRRLLNCRRGLPEEVRTEHMNEHMRILKRSGYSEKFRLEILKSADSAYCKMIEQEEKGERKMYRRKEDNRLRRWKEKREKGKKWQGDFKSVIFVPFTRDSKLCKELQKTEERLRIGGREEYKIRIVERAGPTIGQKIIKKNPFKTQDCGDKKCFPCNSVEEKDKKKRRVSCRKNGVGYSIYCKICEREEKEREEERKRNGGKGEKKKTKRGFYIGETGQNGITRGNVHRSSFESKSRKVKESLAFYKHLTMRHETIKFEDCTNIEEFFRMEVQKVYRWAVDRQVDEGNRMQREEGEIINSKMEWNQPSLSRTVVVRGGAEIL
jgi:hypothetical protein